eukprot:4722031-Amphidinium_carterae.1
MQLRSWPLLLLLLLVFHCCPPKLAHPTTQLAKLSHRKPRVETGSFSGPAHPLLKAVLTRGGAACPRGQGLSQIDKFQTFNCVRSLCHICNVLVNPEPPQSKNGSRSVKGATVVGGKIGPKAT